MAHTSRWSIWSTAQVNVWRGRATTQLVEQAQVLARDARRHHLLRRTVRNRLRVSPLPGHRPGEAQGALEMSHVPICCACYDEMELKPPRRVTRPGEPMQFG